ncbi:MAG: ATP phosphoribosyltransferase regulatory subunit [Aphanocapsa sp. GSE-SYN-MK-11-07L]|jgi:ATP phosphoribosyltransferase regulatory subunit|nr:ATP phosphoribosyltransferase regulatory subunit [Aphanocapsa sp. GSE-SYN-MK-11-07L]
MIYQPPAGARDFLPLEVVQKRWLEQRLQQTFASWSYQQIITPTLERLDTLMAGEAIKPETVIQLRDAEEGLLGLRPELTASIARAAVTRMAGAIYPQRLYYNANIFRRSPTASSQQEFFQAGVELLGSHGLMADAEILLLLRDCLTHLNLHQWQVILGEAGLTTSLLSVFPDPIREQVRRAIAQLDRVGLLALPLTPELRQRASLLMDLRGQPAQVLARVAKLDLEPDQQLRVQHLQELTDLLADKLPLHLDLSLLQTFDYYTGIVFEVIATTKTEVRVVGQGGRYDSLLALYHPQQQIIPGIGFSLNLEDLHQVALLKGHLPHRPPASNWLVVPQQAQAIAACFAYAQTLRSESPEVDAIRVEIALEPRSPAETRDYARQRQIPYIAWIGSNGTPKIEAVDLAQDIAAC